MSSYKHNIIQTFSDIEKRNLISKLFNNMNNFNPTDIEILKQLQQKGYNENIPLLNKHKDIFNENNRHN